MKVYETIGYILMFGSTLILILTGFAPGTKQQFFNSNCAAVIMGLIAIGFLAYQKRLERKPII